MDGQRLEKAVSDLSAEFYSYKSINEIGITPALPLTSPDEVVQVSCECCGLEEDCTEPYILKVRESHYGQWVCGLCSEAVKDMVAKLSPRSAVKEALSSHMEFCHRFNSTTRLNPKLSLTCAMKEIAKRISENRNSGKLAAPSKNIHRISSCIPRIDH